MPDLPNFLWDHLVPKTEMTKLFLQQSTLDPTKSAWEFFNAPFDYATTPLWSLGCRIIVHKKTIVRNTWDFHGKYGWSLGCSLEHYRCERVVPKDTKAVQISDTHSYRHHYLTQPNLKPEDCVVHGLQTVLLSVVLITPKALRYTTAPLCDHIIDLFCRA